MLRAAVAILLVTAAVAHAGDWEVQRDPFDRAVIARYKAILAASPHDANALAHVVSLYRRFRTVEKLADEYRAMPETWSSLVVLGLIERTLGDEQALAHFERAVQLRDDDYATWRTLAQLREPEDRISARAALERANDLASPAQEVQALRDLIAFVQKSSDHESEARYFTQLVALVPRDPRVWVERGDAMLLAGRFDLARESFTAAEPLLVADPEERIAVIVRGARVLEKIGKADDGMRELHRALAMAPAGSYAMRDLVQQIVENRRVAKALPQAITELEAMWPEKTRKHFEWSTLATLYEETHDLPRAIAALEAATARSPSEMVSQLRLIELLDREHETRKALERMELVARRAPRDVAIQLALARRYGVFDDRSMRTLIGLAKRSAKDPDTLMAIASLYLEWDRNDLAEGELAKIVALTEASHDPAALAAIGARALELGTYKAARTAYKAATKLSPKDPALWTGLASAHDGLREWELAFDAMDQVLFLIPDDTAHRADRRAARKNFVQILLRTRLATDAYVDSYRQMWEWSFEQDDDLEAGYFLATYYNLSPREDQPFTTLARLHALVPDDADIAKDLHASRSINRLAVRALANQSLPADWFDAPDFDDDHPDSLDGPRFGFHVGAGAGVRGDIPLSVVLGTSLSVRAARRVSLDVRLDWTRRVGDLGSTNAIGASAGLAAHVVTTPQVAFLVGAAERVEMRFGSELMQTHWGRAEASTDFTTTLVLRDAPFVVGTRVEAFYSGRVIGLLEVGFEIR